MQLGKLPFYHWTTPARGDHSERQAGPARKALDRCVARHV